ncbi:MAG: hypothetical protein ABUS79_15480 [Pseudomonadota bacterium]
MSGSPVGLAEILPMLACPRCAATPLTAADQAAGDDGEQGDLSCPSCGARYPHLGGVACVVDEPARRIARWRENLGTLHLRAEQSIALLDDERRLPALLPLTHARLAEQIRVTRRLVAEVDDLLVGALGPPRLPTSDVPGFESRESLHSLHRDWGWPASDENARALACVEKVISAPLGRTLVLGAGACRLAYDLARRDPDALFVAVDDDPLVLLAAARILAGETLSLTEVRELPTEMALLSAVRTLRVPHTRATRVFPLLADGLAPPFRPAAFDTVITPWFIDVVPPDLRDLLGVLRRVLLPGGRWLHFGPLLYPPQRSPARRFSREELLELARRAGFSIEAAVAETLPFSASPLDGRVRLEPCLAFCARVGDLPADEPADLPSWLVLPDLPVPDFIGRALFFHESQGFRKVVQLVDGQRGINDIAALLDAPDGTDPGALKDAIRECLLQVHPACRPAE